MSRRPFLRTILPGVLLHGRQVWLSELVSVALVASLLCALAATGAAIGVNALHMRRNAAAIATLESHEVELSHRVDRLREQQRLLEGFGQLVGSRMTTRRLHELVALVYRSSSRYGYDPLLLVAVIRQESRFNPKALGRFRSGRESGALGLMQITYETATLVARDLGISLADSAELFKPEVNVAIGVAYLTKLIGQFGSFKLGLLAYNQGPAAVQQRLALRQPLPMAYYEKVLRYYYRLKKAADEVRENS